MTRRSISAPGRTGPAALVLAAAAAFGLAAAAPDDPGSGPTREVIFNAADGVRLHGDLYLPSGSKASPTLVLFHQAGGRRRAEYGPLVGRLTDRGYNVFAVDQRVGGSRLGGTNRTVAGLAGGREYGYCDAMPDLEAALDYLDAQGYTGPRAIWGSSYSAALVLRLAAKRGDRLAAVLAFSPASGGPMADCRGEDVAAEIGIPALIMRPGSEMERESSQRQRKTFEERGFAFHVAEQGVHGSSMLNSARASGDVEPTWKVVLDFLGRHLPTGDPAS